MIIAVNYANKSFYRAQKLNSKTALAHGADRVIEYRFEDIDSEFLEKNRKIFSQKKGNGCFLWKPYFLYRAFQEMGEEDYVIYTDSGSVYIDDIGKLISCMEQEQVDLMTFCLGETLLERKYTKRDALLLMDADEERFVETPQSVGGYVLFKKTAFVENFLKEDLQYAQDPRIITDFENEMGKPNYEGFVAHRHDQSVWSLMVKKYGLKRFRDPSQFGLKEAYAEEILKRSTYPQIIDSHRMNVGSLFMLRFRRTGFARFFERVLRKIF